MHSFKQSTNFSPEYRSRQIVEEKIKAEVTPNQTSEDNGSELVLCKGMFIYFLIEWENVDIHAVWDSCQNVNTAENKKQLVVSCTS